MSPRAVLDAWAVLALLQGEEPAASQVRETLEEAQRGHLECFISLINLGEVATSVGRIRGEAEARETLDEIRRLPLTVLPASDEAVWAAAVWKMHHALSYADAFAAAAAHELGAVLVTGDPELESLRGEVQVEMLRRDRGAAAGGPGGKDNL